MEIQAPDPKSFIEFLIADFHDTSEHLKVTGRKIEFTFQLYAGFLSVIVTVLVSLLALGSENLIQLYSKLDVRVIYNLLSAVLFLLGALTIWTFEFSLRGSMMNSLYINRMNFLRREIYRLLGKNPGKLEGFAFASLLLPKSTLTKVGMTDLFPLALENIFSFFIFPAMCVCIFLGFDPQLMWAKTNNGFAIGLVIVAIISVVAIYGLFERRWKWIVEDTQKKIHNHWNGQK